MAPDVSREELERAATFRSSLRRFLAQTEEASARALLTSQRYDLLLAVKTSAAETSTVGEIATRLSLRQPAATELVKRAEKAGLIERAVSEQDRRVSFLRLTGSAEQRLLQVYMALAEERRELAETMRAVEQSFRSLGHLRTTLPDRPAAKE